MANRQTMLNTASKRLDACPPKIGIYMHRPRLLIAARSRLVREGLKLTLNEAPYLIEDTPSVAAAEPPAERAPDMVLWGPATPLEHLRDEIAFARRAWGGSDPKLILIADVASTAIARRLAALDLDAVLSDDISAEILHRSIELVALGERLFPHVRAAPAKEGPPSRGDVVAFPRRTAPEAPPRAYDVVLSGRESQILQQLVDGATNKVIARQLQIAEATVKVHVKGLLRKIRATNRTQAAIWALHNRHRVADWPEPVGPATRRGP
jgi:two-component system, NarL family, nitrate/nitrite response regulator NarL